MKWIQIVPLSCRILRIKLNFWVGTNFLDLSMKDIC